MRRIYWTLYYFMVGKPRSLSDMTMQWCRLNGVKFTELRLAKCLPSDYISQISH